MHLTFSHSVFFYFGLYITSLFRNNYLFIIVNCSKRIVCTNLILGWYCHDETWFAAKLFVSVSLYFVFLSQGYDMEDAMILNKSSFERGFAHGTVYKTEVYIVFGCIDAYVSPWFWFNMMYKCCCLLLPSQLKYHVASSCYVIMKKNRLGTLINILFWL